MKIIYEKVNMGSFHDAYIHTWQFSTPSLHVEMAFESICSSLIHTRTIKTAMEIAGVQGNDRWFAY